MKNKKLILAVTLTLIFLASIGFSYAYFTATIVNKDVKDQIVQTGTLQLTYIDGDEIVGTNIQPGWTATKTIKVVNTGTLNAIYNLKWKELTNEIINNELVYTISCESNNSFCKYVNQYETAVPNSSEIIKDNIMIYPGEEQVFTINFTFKELNISQDYNQNKKFSGVLNIGETSSSDDLYNAHIRLLDSSSNPLSNYKVELNSKNTGSTDENGYVVLKNVLLGNYDLVIKDSNDNTIDTRNISISENKESSINENNIVASVMGNSISLNIDLTNDNKINTISNKMVTPSECFEFSEGTITNYYNKNENCSNDVVIPENINGVGVTAIGNYAFLDKEINSVVFPNTLESIGSFAFLANNLRKVEFGSNLKKIMPGAFMSNQLNNVNLSNGIEKLTNFSFYDNLLEKINIPSSVVYMGPQVLNQNLFSDNDAFIYKRNDDGTEDRTIIVSYAGKNPNVIIPQGVTKINTFAFSGVPSLTYSDYAPLFSRKIESVSLPDTVTELGFYSFYENNIKVLNIPDSVIKIGSGSFSNNILEEIKLPESLEKIEDSAFSYNLLKKISIPNNVTEIARNAFQHNKLNEVNFSKNLTTIGLSAFSDNDLSTLSLQSSITSIGEGAFNNNKLPDEQAYIYARNVDGSEDKTTIISYGGLNKNIVIPNTVTKIGNLSFSECEIESVIIPDSVTVIESSAFLHDKLYDVTLPKNLTSIGANAFSGNSLSSINIPETVTTIGRMAFYKNKLSKINIPSKLTKIDELVFAKNRLTNINIPKTITSIGASAFNDNLLSDSQAIIYARNEDGSDDKTTIVSYGGANKNIVVPDGVTTLNRYAFYECMLKSITLPESLVTIGSTSLCGNLLETISIPSSVNEISDNAFCSNNFKNAIIKGKTSSSEFKTYSPSWSWNSKVTCIKNNTSNVENGCITWEGK